MFQPTAEQLPPRMQIMTMICGFMASQAIHTAAELRLADLVQDGPKSTAMISTGRKPRWTTQWQAASGLGDFGWPARNFDTELLGVLRIEQRPTELHRLASNDAADGSSAEKVIQNIETNVPPGSTH